MAEQVNHPKHYNSHPAGIECIDIIRHYTCDIANAIKYLWRAGLKAELGKDDADKEIEDLHKALWYIEDYRSHLPKVMIEVYYDSIGDVVQDITTWSVDDIVKAYDSNVKRALTCLLSIGITDNGMIFSIKDPLRYLAFATEAIQQRIIAIEKQLVKHEIDETLDVLHGVISKIKPACKRETEPADYDPMNLIVIDGDVYGLTDEVKKKDNGGIYNPCELCYLSDVCVSKDGNEPVKMLCLHLHQAYDHQYYRSIGRADYRPQDGSIVVVDEHKELEAELREINED